MKKQQIARLIIGSLVGATLVTAHAAPPIKPVQCYGIAKAHKNDCGTPKHACAGIATTNNDPSEWIFASSDTACVNAGGSLEAGITKK